MGNHKIIFKNKESIITTYDDKYGAVHNGEVILFNIYDFLIYYPLVELYLGILNNNGQDEYILYDKKGLLMGKYNYAYGYNENGECVVVNSNNEWNIIDRKCNLLNDKWETEFYFHNNFRSVDKEYYTSVKNLFKDVYFNVNII